MKIMLDVFDALIHIFFGILSIPFLVLIVISTLSVCAGIVALDALDAIDHFLTPFSLDSANQ